MSIDQLKYELSHTSGLRWKRVLAEYYERKKQIKLDQERQIREAATEFDDWELWEVKRLLPKLKVKSLRYKGCLAAYNQKYAESQEDSRRTKQ
jgi:hypothetical protein